MPLLRAGALLSIALLGACGDVENDGSKSGTQGASGGSTSGTHGVPCEGAKDGDPCDVEGEGCGAIECYGCYTHCADGAWKVACTEAPTCADVTVEQGAPCDNFCVQLTCGPFDIATACGDGSVQAACSSFGWFYELPCNPDCESLDQTTCSATKGCAWAVPCKGNPNTARLPAHCIDFPPPIGLCGDIRCAAGESCAEVSLNQDVGSGDCSGGGALVPWCYTP